MILNIVNILTKIQINCEFRVRRRFCERNYKRQDLHKDFTFQIL